MKSSLRIVLDGGFDTKARLAVDDALTCQRAWPFGEAGWLALLGSDSPASQSSWAVLHPRGEWPKALRRVFDLGQVRWLMDHELAAWPLTSDPILSGEGGEANPTRLGLPGVVGPGRLVGYKPLRRMVSAFFDGRGRPIYFTKHLRAGEAKRTARHHALIESLWSREPRFAVPELLQLDERPSRIVWRGASGLSPAAAQAERDLAEAIVMASRCLAALHAGPTVIENERPRLGEITTARRWLSAAGPTGGLAASLEASLAALERVAPTIAPATPVLSHGDFHDGQTLVDGDRVTLLDIDTLARAEPELDVGNFLAHLDLLTLERRAAAVDDLEQTVLEAYAEGGGRLDAVRTAWYRATATLRLASVHASRPRTRHLTRDLTLWGAELASRLCNRKEEFAS